MTVDIELEAMGAIATALAKIDDNETRSRVLWWAADRYGLKPASAPSIGGRDVPAAQIASQGVATSSQTERTFEDFVDLFDAVDPKTDVEKVVTAAYWLQVVNRQTSWQSVKINNLLKDTGHGIGNITTPLTAAQNRKPALVRQMAKAGKAAQSWKTYKLTTSGVAYVRGKLGITGAVPAALKDSEEEESN